MDNRSVLQEKKGTGKEQEIAYLNQKLFETWIGFMAPGRIVLLFYKD